MTVSFGIHAGDDIAPWNAAAHPTGMALVRWVSKQQRLAVWWHRLHQQWRVQRHDNLQQFNLLTHRFNETGTFVTITEAYYIYQSHLWEEPSTMARVMPGSKM